MKFVLGLLTTTSIFRAVILRSIHPRHPRIKGRSVHACTEYLESDSRAELKSRLRFERERLLKPGRYSGFLMACWRAWRDTVQAYHDLLEIEVCPNLDGGPKVPWANDPL